MNQQTTLKKIGFFPLTRMIIGIGVVVAATVLGEWIKNLLNEHSSLPDFAKQITGVLLQVALALFGYIRLFRVYEKRKISELSLASLPRNALAGFSIGFFIQSLSVFMLYLAGDYHITGINPLSTLMSGLMFGITAGFIAELILRGIAFRLLEEWLGTRISLAIFMLFFAVMHINQPGATWLSILSITIHSGLLLSAGFIYSRSLWLPIFLHLSWDFAEPGIYGGANPGTSDHSGLFISQIQGPGLFTGGQLGPGTSLQATMFCLITALWFLWLAKREGRFIKPGWEWRL
ncbi:MAG TPA: type II CAAX endopeptidase family protein [Puia sp.]|nr:type II CAAX endopeptidase family protein [Puia sp.]